MATRNSSHFSNAVWGIQHVREKFACRKCFGVTQPPAPFHPISRGRAGPELLAQVLFAKYRAHLPLNRQSEMWAEEGVNLDVSTLADWVGACAATLTHRVLLSSGVGLLSTHHRGRQDASPTARSLRSSGSVQSRKNYL